MTLFAIALLYSCVGHAGASGYIAALTFMGISPELIRPWSLLLNLAVGTLTWGQFWKAGHFSSERFKKLLLPLALTGMPAAFAGAALPLPAGAVKLILGITLLLSALRFLIRPREPVSPQPPGSGALLATGAALGLASGITGTGGGIFLTPLLLLAGWSDTRTTAAASAGFIVLNSASGLLGQLWSKGLTQAPDASLFGWVLAGGLIGSYTGARRLPTLWIQRVLALVLVLAGAKLLKL